MTTWLVTGGAGFIGGNFVHHWLARHGAQAEKVVVLDKLTYAGNPHTIAGPLASGQATLVQADIADRDAVRAALEQYKPREIAGPLGLADYAALRGVLDGAV
jgi:dTDP-glucose 4,6-dehydratase